MFKVFLVEDEVIVREGIRNNIQWEQYGFIYSGDASDGELALPQIRKIKPDLLITDIKMPFMDGLALIEFIRKELPNTKIIIVSGYDDFSYAQQAIRMGVEQYLLKPIAKEKMVETLVGLHKKMENELQQKAYLEKFEREAQEYETFSRRRFLEKIVTGGLSVLEISETAKAMGIDINAPFYNVVLFSLNSTGYNASTPESYTFSVAAVQDNVRRYLVSRPEYNLFRWNVNTYAILINGSRDDIGERTLSCVDNIKSQCEPVGEDVNWYIAQGTPVARLSSIPACFTEASRILSFRYLCPQEHILSEESIHTIRNAGRAKEDMDSNEVCQERIYNFLSSGSVDEIDQFIEQLLQNAEDEPVSLPIFCRYLTMTVYFASMEYLDSIGCRPESFGPLGFRPNDGVATPDEVRNYARQVMGQAMELRDSESKKQQRDLLTQAIEYIDGHYSDEMVSLDTVAREVNISPNYFSAMFSQEVGKTFVEYLTGKRIGEAKRMLRKTEKRSSEIAFAVGYKDPHYFSFVFKKVLGCTPSEYRRGERH